LKTYLLGYSDRLTRLCEGCGRMMRVKRIEDGVEVLLDPETICRYERSLPTARVHECKVKARKK
jgi:hypothetical protein